MNFTLGETFYLIRFSARMLRFMRHPIHRGYTRMNCTKMRYSTLNQRAQMFACSIRHHSPINFIAPTQWHLFRWNKQMFGFVCSVPFQWWIISLFSWTKVTTQYWMSDTGCWVSANAKIFISVIKKRKYYMESRWHHYRHDEYITESGWSFLA